MNIVIDCRMSGKSGIGTFLDGILPFFSDGNNKLLLLGFNSVPDSIPHRDRCVCCPCTIEPFSMKELFFFPKSILNIINMYDVYFTPYCNIPNGIHIAIYSTIHDIVFLDMPQIAGKFGTFARKLFYLHAIHVSKSIFTVSNFSKSRIIEKLHCKKPIYVVYNGIPHYLEKAILPKPDKTNTIIYIGNIKPHKGLSTLLTAFLKFRTAPLFSEGNKPQLLIVGSSNNFRTKDNQLSHFLTNAKENGISFTGYVDDNTLHLLISQARILVQPSLYEGFGIPPLEALYSGTNVILSDIEVFKEIYDRFPVTFFSAHNADNLYNKMITVWQSPTDISTIPSIYSYDKTASLIVSHLDS